MRLILGTAQLCNEYGVVRRRQGRICRDDSLILLERASELGIEALDTAPAYGDAEAVIGRSKTDFAVHTKLDPSLPPGHSLRGSAQRLGGQAIEVVYMHDPTSLTCGAEATIEEGAEAARTHGALFGVSIYSEEEFLAAASVESIQVIQVPLNVLDRRFSGGLVAQASNHKTIYGRSVLLQGLLAEDAPVTSGATSRLAPHLEAFGVTAHRLGRTRVELALGWAKTIRGLSGVVVGTDMIEDLEDLVAAFSGVELNSDELDEVDRLELPPGEWVDPRRWSQAKVRES